MYATAKLIQKILLMVLRKKSYFLPIIPIFGQLWKQLKMLLECLAHSLKTLG